MISIMQSNMNCHNNTNIIKKTINDLSRESLSRIFQFIEPVERLKCQNVCKRWRQIVDQTYSDQTTVNIQLLKGKKNSNELALHFPQLKLLIKKCGSSIKKITLDHSADCYQFAKSTSRLCFSFDSYDYILESTDIVEIYILLKEHCKNLKSLKFYCNNLGLCHTNLSEFHKFSHWLNRNQGLIDLEVRCISMCNHLLDISTLPISLTHITLGILPYNSPARMLMSKFPRMESLTILSPSKDRYLIRVVDNMPNLKTLDMNYVICDLQLVKKVFSPLHNLQKLSIKFDTFTKEQMHDFFSIITIHCQQIVSFSYTDKFNQIHNHTLQLLAKRLPNLKTLTFGGKVGIYITVFPVFPKLETLTLENFIHLEADLFIKSLESMEKLRNFAFEKTRAKKKAKKEKKEICMKIFDCLLALAVGRKQNFFYHNSSTCKTFEILAGKEQTVRFVCAMGTKISYTEEVLKNKFPCLKNFKVKYSDSPVLV